jgi:uncharacterized protein YbjT (DUF2867 family)
MATTKGPVLVIAATGQQGRATTGQLLQRGWEVRAFVRDLEAPAATKLRDAGANLIEGDLDEPASVQAAMTGAYGVFMMLTPMSGVHITTEGIAAEIRWGTTIVDLAAELSMAHLVYSSLRGAGQNAGVDYYAAKEAIEARIHQTGIPATILRPTFFMDNLQAFNRPVLDDNGGLVVNLAVRSDIPVSLVSTADIGAFAAIAFDRPAAFIGRTVELAGDYFTPPEIAEVIGRHAGLPARSHHVPVAQVKAFDEHIGQMFAHFNDDPDGPLDIASLRAEHPGPDGSRDLAAQRPVAAVDPLRPVSSAWRPSRTPHPVFRPDTARKYRRACPLSPPANRVRRAAASTRRGYGRPLHRGNHRVVCLAPHGRPRFGDDRRRPGARDGAVPGRGRVRERQPGLCGPGGSP